MKSSSKTISDPKIKKVSTGEFHNLFRSSEEIAKKKKKNSKRRQILKEIVPLIKKDYDR